MTVTGMTPRAIPRPRAAGLPGALVLPAAALLSIALTGCGKTHAAASGPASGIVSIAAPAASTRPPGTPGPALARAAAHTLLAAITVHDATVVVPARAGGHLSAAPDTVDVHETWRVAAAPAAVASAIGAAHPAELTPTAHPATVILQGIAYTSAATFSAKPAGGLASEALSVSLTAAPNNGTLLRADAQVAWLGVRPPSQQLPAGIKRIGVIRAEFQPGLRHWVIRDPAEIRKIVRAMESLPTIATHAGCPVPATSHRSEVTLRFRGANGKVVAEAAQPSGPEIDACNPMYFSVGVQEEPSLAHGARVIAVVGRILGRNLVTGQ